MVFTRNTEFVCGDFGDYFTALRLFPLDAVLKIVTNGSAETVGVENTGSILKGKKADLLFWIEISERRRK